MPMQSFSSRQFEQVLPALSNLPGLQGLDLGSLAGTQLDLQEHLFSCTSPVAGRSGEHPRIRAAARRCALSSEKLCQREAKDKRTTCQYQALVRSVLTKQSCLNFARIFRVSHSLETAGRLRRLALLSKNIASVHRGWSSTRDSLPKFGASASPAADACQA